ncbi:MAG: efflux RND transporter periplasmic adaptor subunit [Bacteroidota bacterium]|nr:efflux RND transporter periplasmic adaptor subunit [Bacteroidota bacterium]
MTKYFLILAFFFTIAGCSSKDENTISASGTIETTEVNMGSKSPGQIVHLLVDEGTAVHPGDTLALIDTTNYALNYQQALSVSSQAEAQLLLQEHGSRREDIEQSAEGVKQAQANYANAKQDADRLRDLLASSAATQKQYDDAATKLESAQAVLNASKQAYQKLESGARAEDIAAAKARFEQTKAQANLALQALHDCVVISPVSGTVTHKVLNQGEMAAPNGTIVTISVIDPVKLTIYVSDKDLGKVKLGEKATVKIDSYKDKTYTGTVIYISPQAEFTPKNVQTTEDREKLVFAVKIEVANPDGALKPGMPADAVLK